MGIQAIPNRKVGISYPKLMVRKNGLMIVLFTSNQHGTVVHTEAGSDPVGFAYTHWDMSEFEDYYGTLTLQNN